MGEEPYLDWYPDAGCMSHGEFTRILDRVRDGDLEAREELLELVYRELRAMAGAHMRDERPDHTLQPTALVHEAYLRLAPTDFPFDNRAHFFGSAARAMRRILVEHARKRSAARRGGTAERVTLHELAVATEDPDMDLLALDRALEALAEHDSRLAEVVHLRYFAGLGIEETSLMTGTSPATVKRDWTYARAWLLDRMS